MNRTTARRLLTVALLCLGVAALAPARPALAASTKAKARTLFRQGNKLLSAKRYEEALAKFREAAKAFPSFKIDLNIATTLTQMGRLAEAARFYQRFLRRGSQSAPASILAAARGRLGELKKKLAVVEISTANIGAEVSLNGAPVGTTPLDGELFVMPGPCRIELKKEGREPFAASLTLSAGELKRLVVTLTKKKLPPVEPPKKPVVVEPAPKPEPPPPPSDWKKTAGWITLAVGGASLVTGVIFSGLAASKASEYDEAAKDGVSTHTDLKPLEDENAKLKTGQIVTLTVGGVVAAAGAGLLLWHYLGGERGSEHAAVVLPLADGQRVGASFRIRF